VKFSLSVGLHIGQSLAEFDWDLQKPDMMHPKLDHTLKKDPALETRVVLNSAGLTTRLAAELRAF